MVIPSSCQPQREGLGVSPSPWEHLQWGSRGVLEDLDLLNSPVVGVSCAQDPIRASSHLCSFVKHIRDMSLS